MYKCGILSSTSVFYTVELKVELETNSFSAGARLNRWRRLTHPMLAPCCKSVQERRCDPARSRPWRGSADRWGTGSCPVDASLRTASVASRRGKTPRTFASLALQTNKRLTLTLANRVSLIQHWPQVCARFQVRRLIVSAWHIVWIIWLDKIDVDSYEYSLIHKFLN